MTKLIFDAEDAIVGRLGSVVAKELLRGNEVVIVNAEKAIISGAKEVTVEKIKKLRKKGGSSQKGPTVSKIPEMLLKRMIRGMLPWDRPKGRAAYRRLKCLEGNAMKGKKLNHPLPAEYITIKDISKLL